MSIWFASQPCMCHLRIEKYPKLPITTLEKSAQSTEMLK